MGRRELDVDVFKILHIDMINEQELDSDDNATALATTRLQPPQLRFLLDDLLEKVTHALPTCAPKRMTFLKVSRVRNRVDERILGKFYIFCSGESWQARRVFELGAKRREAVGF